MVAMDYTNQKLLRKEMLLKRDSYGKEAQQKASTKLCQLLLDFSGYKNADILLGFAPFGSEIDIFPVVLDALEQKKQVYLPKIVAKENDQDMEFYQITTQQELSKGYYGIREPAGCHSLLTQQISADANILVLVPGLVFDENGNRIGYGKGFYDRFFYECQYKHKYKNMLKLGTCFSFQVIKQQINAKETDMPVDYIGTQHGLKKV